MIRAAIFETSPQSRARLRDWIIHSLIQLDREMDVLWFTEHNAADQVGKYAKTIQLAFIALDTEAGRGIGRLLYTNNPECRICYYKAEPCDLEPLLATRPAAFFLWNQGEKRFQKVFSDLLCEATQAADVFFYEDRRGITCIPYARILYLQSDLKHVELHTDYGETMRFFSKLSLLESSLDQRFLRIHKSYIVNMRHIEFVDRTRHEVRLSNNTALPISDVWYEKTLARVRSEKRKMEG